MSLLNTSQSHLWSRGSDNNMNLFTGSANNLNCLPLSSAELMMLGRSLTDMTTTSTTTTKTAKTTTLPEDFQIKIPQKDINNQHQIGIATRRELSSMNQLYQQHRHRSTTTKSNSTENNNNNNPMSSALFDLTGTLKAMQQELDMMKHQLEVKTGVVEAVTKLFSLSQSTPNLEIAGLNFQPQPQQQREEITSSSSTTSSSSMSQAKHFDFRHASELCGIATKPSSPDRLSCGFDGMLSAAHVNGVSSSHMDLNRYKRENAINNLKYKTSLCRHYEKKSTCPLGMDCQFAHGMHELRHIQTHPLYKTRICRLFLEQDNCPYGDRCYYYHTDRERDAALMSRELIAIKNNRSLHLPALFGSNPSSNSIVLPTNANLLDAFQRQQQQHENFPNESLFVNPPPVVPAVPASAYTKSTCTTSLSSYESNHHLEEIERKFHEQAMDSASSSHLSV